MDVSFGAEASSPGERDGHPSSGPLLSVEDLTVKFHTDEGDLTAVDGVSYSVAKGEILVLLGESGSGKSVSVRAVMGLLPSPPAQVTGRIIFRGRDMQGMSNRDRRDTRGRRIALVPQDAQSALNPVFTVGWQIGEMLRVHQGANRQDARQAAIDLMQLVHIPAAAQRVDQYPHEFSGGMRQRVAIAMGIALKPDLIIADEPTTALDVTTQSQILGLLKELHTDHRVSIILITHDFGVAAEIADRVAVMYAGNIVELGRAEEVLRWANHPYTLGLRKSIPLASGSGRLEPLKGMPPDLLHRPSGCPFHPRCNWAQPGLCDEDRPELIEIRNRQVACFRADEVGLANSDERR